MSRKAPELNTGSMADISFLLLTFFLLVSNIDTDLGLARKLPPMPEKDAEVPEVNERNVFVVLVNAYDMLMVEGRPSSINTLRKDAKNFFLNPSNDPNLSEKKFVEIPNLPGGPFEKSRGIISLQNDRGTSYEMYVKVQNELAAAVNELRNELAIQRFQKKFDDLDETQAKAISDAMPMAISEAEPKDIGGTK